MSDSSIAMSSFIIYTFLNFWFKKLITGLILLNVAVLTTRLLFAKCKYLLICRYHFKGIDFLNIGVSITALFDQFICIFGFFTCAIIMDNAKYLLISLESIRKQVSSISRILREFARIWSTYRLVSVTIFSQNMSSNIWLNISNSLPLPPN